MEVLKYSTSTIHTLTIKVKVNLSALTTKASADFNETWNGMEIYFFFGRDTGYLTTDIHAGGIASKSW